MKRSWMFGVWISMGALLGACDQNSGESGPAGGTDPNPVEKKEIKVPVTGISQIQDSHEEIKAEIVKAEAAAKTDKPAAPWLLANQLKAVDNLIAACERARKEEARQRTIFSADRTLAEQGKLEKKRTELFEERKEIEETIRSARRGTGTIPRGFTEAELLDRVGDLDIEIKRVEKATKELQERLVAAKKAVETNTYDFGDSLFSREIEDLRKTRARVERLVKKN